MCSLGRIAYGLPFDKIEWSEELKFPELKQDYQATRELGGVLQVKARTRKFNFQEARLGLIFDANENPMPSLLRCVIVGKDKNPISGGRQLHHVLIIQPEKETQAKFLLCVKRRHVKVGMGSIEMRYINTTQPPVDIVLV